jgi:ferredoxin-type protein NapH
VSLRKTLRQNRWRYLSLVAGFFLFVGPFAFLARGLNYLTGNMAQATAHTLCLRMPVDWLFGGRWLALLGSVAALFILVVVGIALFAGPAFCGWLCPVGGISESLSRGVPLPERFRLRIKDPLVTTGLRYGFFIGFIAVSVIVASRFVAMSSICCRYCSSAVMQSLVDGAFGNTLAVTYWHTGAIISLFAWLVVGGIAMSGGRGWCLFFCPVGALSGLSHRVGRRLGMYGISFHQPACRDCTTCQVSCPTWAVREDRTVNPNLCIVCKECVTSCPNGSYKYGKERDDLAR